MKTLKQFRENYEYKNSPQVSPEALMLESPKSEKRKSLLDVPSPVVMPNLLMFRRITYRKYPGDQTVALYYSKTVDKYLSIPFGPTGNLNLSESTIYDTLEELEIAEGAKWEAIKGGLKGALHGAAKGIAKGNAIAAEPGMAIGGVVGAAHGAYKGAKSAYKKSKDVNEDWQSVNRKDKTDGLSQAAVNAYRRENPGSKLQTAVTEKNPSGKRAARRKSFCARMGGMKKRLTSAKTARDPDSRINKALRRWNCEESFNAKLQEKREERLDEFLPIVAAGGAAIARAAGSQILKRGAKAISSYATSKLKQALSGSDEDKKSNDKVEKDTGKPLPTGDLRKAQVRSYVPKASEDSAIERSRQKTLLRRDAESSNKKQVDENKISNLRKMVNENINTMDLNINGRTITLNNSMAKRIVEVYDSVNTKNKKIVEGMLNEDLESFKKLLNFSIKA